MEFTLVKLAGLLKGRVVGNPEAKVSSLCKIEEGAPGGLTFLSNLKYSSYLYENKATAVVVSEDFKPEKKVLPNMIVVKDAYMAFTQLLEFYNQFGKRNKQGTENFTFLDPSITIPESCYVASFVYLSKGVELGEQVKIYPNTYIGENVTIGKGTVIHSGVNIYEGTVIGENCIIHSGTVIGSDGFGFAPKEDGSYQKIPQTGNVIIGDQVELGACVTIDRATLGSTIIENGVKIDNQVQIAHNVKIEQNTVIASQSGIAGSTKVGKNVIVGGQVGIVGHLQIPDGVQIQAQSGVNKNPKQGMHLYGSPAMEASKYRKSYVHFRNLDSIVARMNQLEKKIKELES